MKKALIVVNLVGFLHFLWNDIKILQEMGYEVSVASNEHSGESENQIEIPRLNEMNIKHYQIDFDTKKPLNSKNFKAYKQIKKILSDNKYDLIHCHTPIVGIITRMAAQKYRRIGTKVIYTTHGFTFTDRSPRKDWIIYFNAEKVMSRFCDAIVTINHEDYDNAKKMHCKNVYLMPSVGLDNSRFRNININREAYRKQFGVNKNDSMILAVGELSERKNHQIIIRAIAKLRNKDKFVFVICGQTVVNSMIKQELQKLAAQLDVRIFFAGHRYDIPEINVCADMAVIPSIREGFGMTGVEALASGVPVIGSDVQGIREYVVPGETGYLCNPYDECQFANAIKKINELTYEKRKNMEIACKKKAEEFDVSKSIIAIKNIYWEVTKYDKKHK